MKKILEQADEIVREMEEHIEIAEMLDERKKTDNGIRYTLDEAKRKIKENRHEVW